MTDTATNATSEVVIKEEVLTEIPSELSKDKTRPQVIDKGTYKLEQSFFTKTNEGFSFFTLQFKNGTEAEAQASLDDMLKRPAWNQTTPAAIKIVDLVNSSIKSATRAKASNILAFDEEEHTEEEIKLERNRLLTEQPCLIDPNKANEYVPGEKDVRSIGGIMKLINTYKKQIDDPETSASERARLKEDVERYGQIALGMIAKLTGLITQS